jgi:hypothetical protein
MGRGRGGRGGDEDRGRDGDVIISVLISVFPPLACRLLVLLPSRLSKIAKGSGTTTERWFKRPAESSP